MPVDIPQGLLQILAEHIRDIENILLNLPIIMVMLMGISEMKMVMRVVVSSETTTINLLVMYHEFLHELCKNSILLISPEREGIFSVGISSKILIQVLGVR